MAGQLWDFWGAGPIGVAVGAEHRREYTEAVGRDASAGRRSLQLNSGPTSRRPSMKATNSSAKSRCPLFRDTFLGEYAELSGSYRSFDYTTAGTGDVYGVNLIYRPIQDITFKTSYNTSFRAPDLGENFSPLGQTFANGFVDPCDTASNHLFGTYAADIGSTASPTVRLWPGNRVAPSTSTERPRPTPTTSTPSTAAALRA